MIPRELHGVARIVLLIGALVFLLYRLVDFTGIRYVTADDSDYAIYRLGSIHAVSGLELAAKVAAAQGRIGQLAQIPFAVQMGRVRSQVLYDFLNLGVFALGVLLAAYVVARLLADAVGLLFLILFAGFLPLLWNHMPPTAYPFFPWLPVIAFCVSFWCLERFFSRGEWIWLVAFGVMLFVSLFSYELFLLVFTSVALLSIAVLSRRYSSQAGATFAAVVATLVVSAIYALVYFEWREASGGHYDGATAVFPGVAVFLQTVVSYSVGGLSFVYLLFPYPYEQFHFSAAGEKLSIFAPYSFYDVVRGAGALDLMMAGFAAGAGVYLVSETSARLSVRVLFVTVLGAMLVAVLSVVLYGVTTKYIEWAANGQIAYVATRYAYFGLILAVCALLAVGQKFLTGRKLSVAYRLLVGVALFGGVIFTSHMNGETAASMRLNSSKWQAVRISVECDAFYGLLKGKRIAAAELWSSVWYATPRADDYWKVYTESVLGKPVDFRRSRDEFDTVFSYMPSRGGKVIGTYVGLAGDGGGIDEIAVLTPRRHAVQMYVSDAEGERVVPLFWNNHTSGCGEYVMNRVVGRSFNMNSVVLLTERDLPVWVARSAP